MPLVAVFWLISTMLGCQSTGNWRGLVKIGLVAPFSGYDTDTAVRMLSGVKSAYGSWNGGQGINGYRIELVALDNADQPAVTAARIRELALDPDVAAAIVRLNGSDDEALGILDRLALPTVVIGSPLPPSVDKMAVWSMCADSEAEGRYAADLAKRTANHPMVIADSGAGYRVAAASFLSQLEGRAVSVFPDNGADQRRGEGDSIPALAKTLDNDRVDFVYFAGPYDRGVQFAREQQAPARLVLSSDSDTSALAALLGSTGRAIAYVASCTTAPQDDKLDSAGQAAVQIAVETGAAAALAYDATHFILSAMREVANHDRPSRISVAAAMHQVPPFNGASGPVEFDNNVVRRQLDVIER